MKGIELPADGVMRETQIEAARFGEGICLGEGLPVVQQSVREGGPDVCMGGVVLQRETVDAERRVIRAVAVNEDPERPFVVWDWVRGEVIDNIFLMSGFVAPAGGQVPLLDTHASYSTDLLRGSARKWEVTGAQCWAELHFGADAVSERSWLLAKDGHLDSVSIGARLLATQYVEPGESAVIQGKTYTAGARALRVNLEWTPMELSLVVMGADPNARIAGGRGAKGAGNKGAGGAGRSEQVDKWLMGVMVSMGLVNSGVDATVCQAAFDALAAEEQAKVKQAAKFAQDAADAAVAQASAGGGGTVSQGAAAQGAQGAQASGGAPANVVDLETVRQEGARLERERVTQIRAAAQGLPGLPEDVVQRAVDQGMTLADANAAFLAAYRQGVAAPVGPNRVSINTGAGRAELTSEVFAAAVCQSANIPWVDESADAVTQAEQAKQLERASGFRGMGPLGLCAELVRQAGGVVGYDRREIVRQAVELDMVRQSASSFNLNNAMAAVTNKRMMQKFMLAPVNMMRLVYETDVSDYKLNTRVGMGEAEMLTPTPLNGKAEHGSGSDRKETYSIMRYAKQLFFDEQLFINDDAGAISRAIDAVANGAIRLVPSLFWSKLLSNPTLAQDGTALFHADHNNTYAHASAVLSDTSLALLLKKMREQYLQEKNEKILLNLSPRYLVVPPALEVKARQLVTSVEVGSTRAGDGTRNVFRDLAMDVLVDGHIGAVGVTNPETKTRVAGLDTNWYLAADPNDAPGFELAYLQGTNRRPVTERATVEAGMFGTALTVKHVVGGAFMGYQAWQYSKGAA